MSRFIPHPPNFTSLLALSFYVPALLGLRYLPALLISFVITDLFIGYHFGTHWTWGSVLIIGLMSKYFVKSFITRISGAIIGVPIMIIARIALEEDERTRPIALMLAKEVHEEE